MADVFKTALLPRIMLKLNDSVSPIELLNVRSKSTMLVKTSVNTELSEIELLTFHAALSVSKNWSDIPRADPINSVSLRTKPSVLANDVSSAVTSAKPKLSAKDLCTISSTVITSPKPKLSARALPEVTEIESPVPTVSSNACS